MQNKKSGNLVSRSTSKVCASGLWPKGSGLMA